MSFVQGPHCKDQSLISGGLQRIVVLFAIACVGWLAQVSAAAQEQYTVSSCPGMATLPVTLQIDCSHLTDPAARQLCRPFIENQACKVFPAYRKITGTKLEDRCKSIKFTIYEDANWPHPKGEGGLALNCAVDYLAQYSVKFRANSKMGPYDVHELLHEYQFALGPLPSMHPLFASSMAEATRQVGDDEQYQRDIKQMQAEAQRLHDELRSGKYKSSPDECKLAQTQVEESLYLENDKTVYAFYRKLGPDKARSLADRQARFNRMFWIVSGPKPEIKQFLTQYCGPF